MKKMLLSIWRKFQLASLRNKLLAMLLIIVLQSIFFTGIITVFGGLYLSSFNNILNDCYDINQLLSTFTAEIEALNAYMLYKDDTAFIAYRGARVDTNRVLAEIDIPYRDSSEQYLLLSAISASSDGFREICDEAVRLRGAGEDYAQQYERVLTIGNYMEGYIKELLQTAISEGQVAYQRDIVKFRLLPAFYLVSVVLSMAGIVLWMRWMMTRVVTPINELIKVTGAMSENDYDAPDVFVQEEGEIYELAQIVNQMKHSTARLVESLQVRQEIESKLHEEEMRRIKMEATMDTLRLSLLQSQINPHFLFNTLNTISRMAQMEGAKATEDLIKRLASLFRYNLQSTEEIVPLVNELKIVQDYIAIQQIRFGERVAFSLVCEPDPASIYVPVFTLQPLIENAVIHGLSPMEAGGEVRVEIRETDENLLIAVRDTGIGMSEEQLSQLMTNVSATRPHVSGLGVGNVRARILAHYAGSTFAIQSIQGEGTGVLITIPLKEVLHV